MNTDFSLFKEQTGAQLVQISQRTSAELEFFYWASADDQIPQALIDFCVDQKASIVSMRDRTEYATGIRYVVYNVRKKAVKGRKLSW